MFPIRFRTGILPTNVLQSKENTKGKETFVQVTAARKRCFRAPSSLPVYGGSGRRTTSRDVHRGTRWCARVRAPCAHLECSPRRLAARSQPPGLCSLCCASCPAPARSQEAALNGVSPKSSGERPGRAPGKEPSPERRRREQITSVALCFTRAPESPTGITKPSAGPHPRVV